MSKPDEKPRSTQAAEFAARAAQPQAGFLRELGYFLIHN